MRVELGRNPPSGSLFKPRILCLSESSDAAPRKQAAGGKRRAPAMSEGAGRNALPGRGAHAGNGSVQLRD